MVGKLIIGVDLGGTQIRAALADGEGRILLSTRYPRRRRGPLGCCRPGALAKYYSELGIKRIKGEEIRLLRQAQYRPFSIRGSV